VRVVRLRCNRACEAMPPKGGKGKQAPTVEISSDAPFEIWLGHNLGKRPLVEVLRSWDKGGDGSISRDEFKTEVRKMGYDGADSNIVEFFTQMDKDRGGTLTISELKEPLKFCIERAVAFAQTKGKHAHRDGEAKRLQSMHSFLEARRVRFEAKYKEACDVRDNPPSERTVTMRLGSRLEKVSNLQELQKMWDRDGDGRINKFEFRERVAEILGKKLNSFPNGQKDLDELYDQMDEDKVGGLDLAEMQPGLTRLRTRCRERASHTRALSVSTGRTPHLP